jgi:hypothetical protein
MHIVEKYRPKRKQYGNPGRFRKCEKKFLAAREKNFSDRGNGDDGVGWRFFDGLETCPTFD